MVVHRLKPDIHYDAKQYRSNNKDFWGKVKFCAEIARNWDIFVESIFLDASA